MDFVLEGAQSAVANLGHFAVVAFALGPFGLKAQVFHFLLAALDLREEFALALPLGAQLVFALLFVGDFGGESLEFGRVVLALDGLALNLQLAQASRNLVQFFGPRIALHTQFGSRFVHQVDGLVGQETVGDVAVRQGHGGDDGIVLNAHAVVILVALFQSAQDADGIFGRRFVHEHRLEASLQRLVLLEILLVFFQRGGTDTAQFAARQGWFQDIGGIHCAIASSRTDQGVNFVDEEDDIAVGLRHLVDHALQTFFKFAFVLRARHEGTHIERIQAATLQAHGHVAAHDTLGQALNDGRLTRTRLTDEDGVVLRASRQDLQHAANLLVASDDGVKASFAGFADEVARILLQGLIGVFARGRVHAVATAQFLDGCLQGVGLHASVCQQLARRTLLRQQGLEQGFQSHITIAGSLR